MDYEFNIIYYMNIYKKWWKKIIAVAGISMFLTMLFSMAVPATYVSTVTLLSGGGESSVGSIGQFLGISSAQSSSNNVIIAILKSRRMAKDINEKFNSPERSGFSYSISTSEATAGLAITVTGSAPDLTQKIADFAVVNLDKINSELDITLNKPMVKVLDPAVRGVRQSRQTPRKMVVAGLLSFLLISLYVFFSDYLNKLKSR